MIRRLLCLIAFLIALAATACGETKPSTGGKKVEDPDANSIPRPGGAKGG